MVSPKLSKWMAERGMNLVMHSDCRTALMDNKTLISTGYNIYSKCLLLPAEKTLLDDNPFFL